jgi:hypothetical protein
MGEERRTTLARICSQAYPFTRGRPEKDHMSKTSIRRFVDQAWPAVVAQGLGDRRNELSRSRCGSAPSWERRHESWS